MSTDNLAEPTMIGLSEKTHPRLKRLRDDGYFSEMADAYRFGIALALAHGIDAQEISGTRQTIFSVATIDPDREIFNAVRMLTDAHDIPVYRYVERLAEWGVNELALRSESGDIDIGALMSMSMSPGGK